MNLDDKPNIENFFKKKKKPNIENSRENGFPNIFIKTKRLSSQ